MASSASSSLRTTARYYSGDDPETLVKVGNLADASYVAETNPPFEYPSDANDGYAFTSPLGSFQPNAFGLFDMHGNARLWCMDSYGEEHYAKSPGE